MEWLSWFKKDKDHRNPVPKPAPKTISKTQKSA